MSADESCMRYGVRMVRRATRGCDIDRSGPTTPFLRILNGSNTQNVEICKIFVAGRLAQVVPT